MTTTTTTIPYTMTNTDAVKLKTATAAIPPPQDDVDGNGNGQIAALNTLSGREARNLAEKQRRDKLNASIQELSTMVPHSAEATRRLDKTAILRFATHGLRLRHVFGKTAFKRKFKEKYKEQPYLTDSILQLLDSFLLTVTCSGQIVLISSSVEQLLGHCQSDLYGQNILQITHPDDQDTFREQLIPNDIELMFARDNEDHNNSGVYTSASDDSSDSSGNHCRTPSPKEQVHLEDIEKRLREDKRSFTVRLARASTRSESTKNYEIVKIDGCFRRSDCTRAAGSYPIVSQLIRRSRTNITCLNNHNSSSEDGYPNKHYVTQQFLQHDAIAQAALHGISGNDIVLVGMARIIRQPQLINRYIESEPLEYKTRHLIDGRIVDCDQRISLVAGYMKEEVRNLSPFSFMHQDDVRWVIVALRQMYDCNSNYGESCYRLLSRNGNFIYLQTKGFMDVDKRTNQVHSFICINTLLSEEEGKRRVQAMKNKFSTIIKAKVPTNSSEDLPASQNPQQLERIVLYLIDNLQKRNDPPSTVTLSEIPKSPIKPDPVEAAPLALVPPEPESVKNSITQSVNVVNVTAARTLQKLQEHRQQQRSLSCSSSASADENSLSPTNSSLNDSQELQHDEESSERKVVVVTPPVSENSSLNYSILKAKLQRPSVLEMHHPAVNLIPSDGVLKRTIPAQSIENRTEAAKTLQEQIYALKRLREQTSAEQSSGSPRKFIKKATMQVHAAHAPANGQRDNNSTANPSISLSTNNSLPPESFGDLSSSLHNSNRKARHRGNTTTSTHINSNLDEVLLEQQMQQQNLIDIELSEYNNIMRQQQQQQQQHRLQHTEHHHQQQHQRQRLASLVFNTTTTTRTAGLANINDAVDQAAGLVTASMTSSKALAAKTLTIKSSTKLKHTL